MARVTFMNEILSGKIGGKVYARNGSGFYCRQYVVPVNTSTPAQQAARASWASSATSWHTLTDAQKGTWNDFAQQYFNPKIAQNIGQFNGFQAYCSLKSIVAQADRMGRTGTFTALPTGTLTQTVEAYVTPNNAPASALQGVVSNGSGAPASPVTLTSVTVNEDGSYEFTADFLNTPSGGLGQGNLESPDGSKLGIAVYISNSKTQAQTVPKNKYNQVLGYTPIGDFATTGLTGKTGFTFASTNNLDPAEYHQFPQAGQYVRATGYLIAQDGRLCPLNSLDVVVS